MAPGFFRLPLRGDVRHQTHQPESIFPGLRNGHFFLQPIATPMPARRKFLFVGVAALAQSRLRPAIRQVPILHLNLMPDLHFVRCGTFAKKPLRKVGRVKSYFPAPTVEHDLRFPQNAVRMLDQ